MYNLQDPVDYNMRKELISVFLIHKVKHSVLIKIINSLKENKIA